MSRGRKARLFRLGVSTSLIKGEYAMKVYYVLLIFPYPITFDCGLFQVYGSLVLSNNIKKKMNKEIGSVNRHYFA